MTDWIEHDGSGMPVPGDTLVYTRHSDGFDDSFCSYPTEASFWDGPFPELSSWLKSDDDDAYIAAYRIVTP